MAKNWQTGVLRQIDFVGQALYRISYSVFKVVDDGYVIRRIGFFWIIWLTTKAFLWAMSLTSIEKAVSWDYGVVIGAVLTPLAGLHAAIFKFYGDSKPQLPPIPPVVDKES